MKHVKRTIAASVLAVFLVTGCSGPTPSSDKEPETTKEPEPQVSLKVSEVQGDLKTVGFERVDGNKPGAPITITFKTENAESAQILPKWQEEPIDLIPVVPGPAGTQVWEVTFIAPAEPGYYHYTPKVYKAGGRGYMTWSSSFELVEDGHEAGWVDLTTWPDYNEDWPDTKKFATKEELAEAAVAAIFAEGGPNRRALAEMRCPIVKTGSYKESLDGADWMYSGLLRQRGVVPGLMIENIFALPLPGEERAEHWQLTEDTLYPDPIANYTFLYNVDTKVVRSVAVSMRLVGPHPDRPNKPAFEGWCLTGFSTWSPSRDDLAARMQSEDWPHLQ